VKLTNHVHLAPRSKNEWSYTSTPQYSFMAWCLVKAVSFPEGIQAYRVLIFVRLFMYLLFLIYVSK
jgi:hypothetical protein